MNTAFKIEGVNVIEEKGLISDTDFKHIVKKEDIYLMDYNLVFKGMVDNLKYLIKKITLRNKNIYQNLNLKYDIKQINEEGGYKYILTFKIYTNDLELDSSFINNILNSVEA